MFRCVCVQFVVFRLTSRFLQRTSRWCLAARSTWRASPSGRRCRSSSGGWARWSWRPRATSRSERTCSCWTTFVSRRRTLASPRRTSETSSRTPKSALKVALLVWKSPAYWPEIGAQCRPQCLLKHLNNGNGVSMRFPVQMTPGVRRISAKL